MYKVLIVEDMDLTREDIIGLIEWQRYGFSLVPDARNGKIGLEHAMRYQPDIIITDIKMPVMTGLDMIQELKNQGCQAAVILLTAYEEFELAKRALQMGVQTFILKYEIDSETLLRELNRCVEQLRSRRNVQDLRTRQKILEVLRGNVNGLPQSGSLPGWRGRMNLILLRKLDQASGVELSEESLQDMLEQRWPEEEIRLFQMNPQEFVVLRRDKSFLSDMRQKESVREFAACILEEMQKMLSVPMAAAVGGAAGKTAELAECLRKAERRMQGYVFAGSGAILEMEADQTKKPLSEELLRKLDQIAQGLEEDTYETVYAGLRELCTTLVQGRNLYWLRKAEERLMYLVTHRVVQMKAEELEEGITCLKETYIEMRLSVFMDQYEKLIAMLEERARYRYSGKVRYIRSYVQENYAKEISLNLLAEEMAMNPIYLSALFKKETGMTFSAYLTKVRIERAIELLRQGDYKIYEISEMVGYQTIQYFSKVFKKETGKKPKDFM